LKFDSSLSVNSSADTIDVSSNTLGVDDLVQYYTSNGNTALSGLSNNSYYFIVTEVGNTVQLSSTKGGSPINITASGSSQNGHFLKLEKLVVNSALSYTNTSAQAISINYDITTKVIGGSQATTGTVTSVFTGEIFVDNVSGVVSQGDLIVGGSSGATATVTNISRNDVVKNFDTFVQMSKYVSTSSPSGTFQLNEQVFQSETSDAADQFANAYIGTIVNNGPNYEYYLSNEVGIFNPNQGFNLIGATSKATTPLNYKYLPELVPGSGKVLFLEKMDVIPRSNTSTETIKFILEF
jgi:hypothetical protein